MQTKGYKGTVGEGRKHERHNSNATKLVEMGMERWMMGYPAHESAHQVRLSWKEFLNMIIQDVHTVLYHEGEVNS